MEHKKTLSKNIQADLLLISTSVLWGFAFVAQRVGMKYIGPFTFNGLRFALGSLVLLPVIAILNNGNRPKTDNEPSISIRTAFWGCLLSGLILFFGASFQQVGIVYTTAGKSGFITGLYVILIPIVGIPLGQRTSPGTWIGAVLAVTGLYLLSVTKGFTIGKGDLLTLIGSFMWAAHVLAVGWLSPRMNSFILASSQYAVCSLLSLAVAIFMESIALSSILQATIPILYGGVISVGIAYTMQIMAQRVAHPAHTAVILTMEGAFAALGGWLLLGEVLPLRGLFGCALMMAGMLLSQLWVHLKRSPAGQ